MASNILFSLFFPGLPALALVFFCRSIIKARRRASRPFDEMRRLPGYSLSKQADERWDTFSTWLCCSGFSAIMPWVIFVLIDGRSIVGPLFLGLITAPFCFWRMWVAYKPLPKWWLGLNGEQYVGAELDSIQNESVKVFHDVVISDSKGAWNIDHVIVTRAGLFTVETKAKRKKTAVASPKHKLSFDGHKVNFPDGTYDAGSVMQAVRQAQWLEREAVTWTGGVAIPVTPILTFPGWWVDTTAKGAVSVLNPKMIRRVVMSHSHVLDDRAWNSIVKQLEALTKVRLEGEIDSTAKLLNRQNKSKAFG